MKQSMKILVVGLMCSFFLVGCGQAPSFTEPVAAEEVRQEIIPATEGNRQETVATVPEQPEITLPTSIALEPQANGYDIVQEGQVVGGLVKTSLMQTGLDLAEGAPETLESYLQSYVEPPLILEYMTGGGLDNVWVEVDLIAYNPETQTAHEDKHNIFLWNGDYWDLWVNPDFIDNKQETAILWEMGLYTQGDSLGKCHIALLELQNRNSYSIRSNTRNFGGPILNETSSYCFYKDGENWLKLGQIPDEGFEHGFCPTGFMCVDGKYYDNVETEWDEHQRILWGESEFNPAALPWIAAFRWDAQEVKFVSAIPAGQGQCITLEVLAPYDQREAEGYDRYQMQFYFDGKDTLTRMKNTVFFHHEKEGDYSAEETIELTEDRAKTVIENTYQQYLNQTDG